MSRLTVIIPGYNTRTDWWTRCVKSVLAALGPDDQVICVDDGSKVVLTAEALGINDPRVKIIRHEKNRGLPSARNTGLDAASESQYVTFVDSDDEVRPETFSRCLAALEQHAADVAVYGVNSLYVNDGFQVHDIPDDKYYGALQPEDVGYLVKKRLFYYSWNKVFRNEYLKQHNFRFYPEGVPCEDAIFNVRLVTEKAKWVTVAYEGYQYYRFDGSLLSSYKPTYMAGTRACTKAWHDYKESTPGAYEGLEKYGLGWYDETSEGNIIRGEWTNIWRRNSPYNLKQRYQFAAEHKAELGVCPPVVFLKKAFLMWARAHLYFRPIRQRHSKRFLARIGAMVEDL